MLFSAFFSRWKLMLSEHLTISECWNLRFPMNSECQFSPDLLSRSNKVTLTDNLDGWQRFDWICHYFNYWREWVRIECGMLSRWEQSCETDNDRSSYHCSKNWTVWELDPDSDKWEDWHRKFIELSSCSSDHSPDYIVRLLWQLNLRRHAWWDLPCRITWQWTISSWNKTGSSICIRLLISPVSMIFPPFESPRNCILNNSCMGVNVRNLLHEAQACFQGSRSIQSPQSYFRKCDCTIP